MTCSDDALPTFVYSIDRAPLNGYEDSLKVSIDPRTSEISVKALPGRTDVISFELTVIGTLPSRQTSSWTFVINLTTCALPSALIASVMDDQIYQVTLPYADYDPPPFAVDPTCPLSLVYTNIVVPNNFITDNGGVGKVVGWETSDTLNVGSYTITITADNSC